MISGDAVAASVGPVVISSCPVGVSEGAVVTSGGSGVVSLGPVVISRGAVVVASIVAGTAVEVSIIRILSSSPLLNSKIATKYHLSAICLH